MTGQMIEKIEEVLLVEKPNFVLVFGDTNSTLAGAIASKKLNMKLVHIMLVLMILMLMLIF